MYDLKVFHYKQYRRKLSLFNGAFILKNLENIDLLKTCPTIQNEVYTTKYDKVFHFSFHIRSEILFFFIYKKIRMYKYKFQTLNV